MGIFDKIAVLAIGAIALIMAAGKGSAASASSSGTSNAQNAADAANAAAAKATAQKAALQNFAAKQPTAAQIKANPRIYPAGTLSKEQVAAMASSLQPASIATDATGRITGIPGAYSLAGVGQDGAYLVASPYQTTTLRPDGTIFQIDTNQALMAKTVGIQEQITRDSAVTNRQTGQTVTSTLMSYTPGQADNPESTNKTVLHVNQPAPTTITTSSGQTMQTSLKDSKGAYVEVHSNDGTVVRDYGNGVTVKQN